MVTDTAVLQSKAGERKPSSKIICSSRLEIDATGQLALHKIERKREKEEREREREKEGNA